MEVDPITLVNVPEALDVLHVALTHLFAVSFCFIDDVFS